MTPTESFLIPMIVLAIMAYCGAFLDFIQSL